MVYLYNQHYDENEDECGVEVGDIERGSQSSDECVTSNDGSQKHRGKFGAEIRHQTERENLDFLSRSEFCLFPPVEHGCSCNGQRHHHDQVCEEREGAEHEVGPLSKPRFNNLLKKNVQIFRPKILVLFENFVVCGGIIHDVKKSMKSSVFRCF